jgi:hypothetical protein
MTTFIFMLTRETQERLAYRVLDRLNDEFPLHEFIAGSADYPEFENAILPAHGESDPEQQTSKVRLEVLTVKEAFQRILFDLRDPTPS